MRKKRFEIGNVTDSLVVCFNAILPIFLVMAIGYCSKIAGFIKEADVTKFNSVVFKVFMPFLTFYSVYSSDLESALHPKVIIYAVAAVLTELFISILFVNKIEKDRKRIGVMIQGLYRSNYVIIGIPLAQSLLKGGDLGIVAILIGIIVPIYNIVAVILLETYNGSQRAPIKKLVLDILKNPLLLGCLAGILALLIKLKLPEPIDTAVNYMYQATGPMLLFLLGAFFRFGKVKEHVGQLAVVCTGRLVVIPAIFLTIGALLGFRGMDFVALIGIFTTPTAIASFPMAQNMGGDAELAGNIVVFTSLICIVTVFAWSFIFRVAGLY